MIYKAVLMCVCVCVVLYVYKLKLFYTFIMYFNVKGEIFLGSTYFFSVSAFIEGLMAARRAETCSSE